MNEIDIMMGQNVNYIEAIREYEELIAKNCDKIKELKKADEVKPFYITMEVKGGKVNVRVSSKATQSRHTFVSWEAAFNEIKLIKEFTEN